MRKVLIAFVLPLLVASRVAATEKTDPKTDVMALAHRFVDSFNAGNTKAAAAACVDDVSIIDEFPPYEWHGAGACAKWMKDFEAFVKTSEITDAAVVLDAARHVDITADRAYAVIPAAFTYKLKGLAIKQGGSMFTLALKRSEAGWRIVAWSWARN